MAESKIETTETPETIVVTVEKPNRFRSFTVNHPRTAKVVSITALTAAVLGAVAYVKNRKQVEPETEIYEFEIEVPSEDAS
jgi:hypothetical protein